MKVQLLLFTMEVQSVGRHHDKGFEAGYFSKAQKHLGVCDVTKVS